MRRSGGWWAFAGVAALALAGCSNSDEFEARMNGSKERPTPVNTGATGNATVEVDGNSVRVKDGTFVNLSSAAVAAHIHGPADTETAAGILCGLTVTPDNAEALSGKITGECNMNDEQIDQLKNGQMYINVHSTQFPQGEIRGQLE